MIKVKTKHGGVSDVIIGEDGHWSFTYVPQSEDDFPCIVHSGIPADEIITYLQLEDGTRATHWVPNTVEESELARIWNDLREIRLDFTNDIDQLEGKFQIRANGILAEFKDSEAKIESHISQTASNIRAEVKDDVNKLESLVNLNSSSLTAKIEDQGRQTSSLVSQTANNLRVQMRDELKDAIATINVSVDSLLTQLENYKRETSTAIAQTDRSIQTRARSVANEAIRTTVPEMIQDEIKGIDYNTIIRQQSDNILIAIKDKLPESKMTGKEIVSAINLSTGGVRIKGSTIALDGNTYMSNAFARKLMVDELQATDVQAFMAKFTNVVANNLDVNKLAGNKATFVQALFNGSHSNLKITGDGIDILRKNGAVNARFSDLGMALFADGRQTGIMQVTGPYAGWSDGLGVVAERGMYAYLGGRTNKYSSSNAFHPSLAVDGSSGDIIFGSPVRPERNSQHSFRFGYVQTPRGEFPSISTNNGESILIFARGDIQYIDSQNRINSLNDALSAIRRS